MPRPVALIDNVCDPQYPATSGHSDIIWAMAQNLSSRGYEVSVVAPYSAVPFDAGPIRIIPFTPIAKRNNVITQSLTALRAALLAKRYPGQIYHVTDAFSAGAAGLVGLKPLVFTTSGNVYQRIHSGVGLDWSAKIGYKFWSRLAAAKADAVLYTSQDMQQWWKRTGMSDARSHFVPLGVNAEFFTPRNSQPGSQKYPFLAISRLAPENNVDRLLEIVAQPSLKNLDFSVQIAGDGALRPQLVRQANELGIAHHINWLGHIEYNDLPQLYQSSRALLFTREEGAPPRVVLQALSSGIPVLSFNSSGISDYVQHQVSGLLAPLGKIQTFAENIELCLKDDELIHQMGKNARLSVEQRFNWPRVIDQIITVYHQFG